MRSVSVRADASLGAVDGLGSLRFAWALLGLALAVAVVARAVLAPCVPLAAVFLVSAMRIPSVEHPARVRILTHLEILPGDHFRSITRVLKLSPGGARHHLNVLVRRRLVREERKDGRCRYYVRAGAVADRNEAFEKFWVYRDLRLRVLHFVRNRGTARPSEVAAGLGISRQLASYHLLRLAEIGHVRREKGRYRVLEERRVLAGLRQKPD